MILRRNLPEEDLLFNARTGSPKGYVPRSVKATVGDRIGLRTNSKYLRMRSRGMFGFQPDNNATRVAEYPWAFRAVPLSAGQIAVDLGGSLGGLQFALSREGLMVINVDPSDTAAMGWPVDPSTIRRMNEVFRTTVELRRAFLADARIDNNSVDRVYCISTIEHIPPSDIPDLMLEIARILRPGGNAVLTVDLFFDLFPFTCRRSNGHGTNIDVRELVEASGLRLVQGEVSELYGYVEFDPVAILSRASEFAQGDLALNVAQAFVLEKVA